MNKQEVIEKAYGDYWEKAREWVDEDGWCIYFPMKMLNVDWEGTGTDKVKYRPKSLQGIETNNGWIKIESEADLPIEENNFFACNGSHIYNFIYNLEELRFDYINDNCIFTHYQPIVKPLKPIY